MFATLIVTPSWIFYTVCALSVAFGLVLRLALELKDGTLTFKTVIVQVMITICTAFLSALIKRDYELKISMELLLFLTSFFAVFLVSTADKAFKQGFKSYLRTKFKHFLAEEKEEKP
jgi:cyanate permease